MDSLEIDQAGLLQRIAMHDPEAVSELYDLQSPPFYTLISQIVADESEAGDILQEVFLMVWSEPLSHNAELFPPSIWLTRAARDLAVGHLRAKSSNNFNQQPLPEGFPALYSGITNSAFDLPPRQRALIEYAYFRGYTQSELAETFNLSLVTVTSEICSGVLAVRTVAFGIEQQTPMMSRYLEELAIINSIGALDGEDLLEFQRLSPNITIEAQKQIAFYEQVATWIALSGAEQKVPPASIKEQLMKRIRESLFTQPPSQ